MRSWNAEGESIDQWRTFTVSDVCVDAAGEHVVYEGDRRSPCEDSWMDTTAHTRDEYMSLFVSKEPRVLVNLANREVRIHHLTTPSPKTSTAGRRRTETRARIAHDARKDSDRQTSIPATASYRLGTRRAASEGTSRGAASAASVRRSWRAAERTRSCTSDAARRTRRSSSRDTRAWSTRCPGTRNRYMLATAGDDASVRRLAPALTRTRGRTSAWTRTQTSS